MDAIGINHGLASRFLIAACRFGQLLSIFDFLQKNLTSHSRHLGPFLTAPFPSFSQYLPLSPTQ